jgi:hypothetical protein
VRQIPVATLEYAVQTTEIHSNAHARQVINFFNLKKEKKRIKSQSMIMIIVVIIIMINSSLWITSFRLHWAALRNSNAKSAEYNAFVVRQQLF